MTEKELQEIEELFEWASNHPNVNLDYGDVFKLIAEVRRLQEEKRVMKKALKFYADETSYITNLRGMEIEATVMQDQGDWAKEVLDQVKGAAEGERD